MQLTCLTDRSIRFPGESWLSTSDNGFRVAVDVGSGYGDFGLKVAVHGPHVLVLTHDDNDHVGGIDDFVQAMQVHPARALAVDGRGGSAYGLLQIWMPFDWVRLLLVLAMTQGLMADASPVLTGPAAMDDAVEEALRTADEGGSRGVRVAGGGRRVATGLSEAQQVNRNRRVFGASDRETSRRRRRDDEVLTTPLDPHGRDDESIGVHQDRLGHLLGAIGGLVNADDQELADAVSDAVGRRRDRFADLFESRNGWTGSNRAIGERAVGTAKRTLAVLQAGVQAGVRLRFFDPDSAFAAACAYPEAPPPWHTEGEPGRLTVVNAREVDVHLPRLGDSPDSYGDALALAARLTVQNRRALATFVWPDPPLPWKYDRGALIWSDTEHRIAGRPPTPRMVPWFAVGVMSAPHHASTNPLHADLWRHRPAHVRVLLSHNSTSDSERFLGIPPSQRDCTKCAVQTPAHPVEQFEQRPWGAPPGRCLDTHVLDPAPAGGAQRSRPARGQVRPRRRQPPA